MFNVNFYAVGDDATARRNNGITSVSKLDLPVVPTPPKLTSVAGNNSGALWMAGIGDYAFGP